MPGSRFASCLFYLLCFAAGSGAEPLGTPRLAWTNNLLTVTAAGLPGGKLEIWYLEAFCRRGARDRNWNQTTLPHKTELVSAAKDGRRLTFLTRVEPSVEVHHELRAGADDIEFRFQLSNKGAEPVDLEWFQPACIRVAAFTGLVQSNYIRRSFIFTDAGLTWLAQTRRTEAALYRGGQVYLPANIPLTDSNPRPICQDHPVNGLIGCVSADDRWLLATAWDKTHELFEGVYVCLHADPHVGGLPAGATRTVRGKLYLLPNNPEALLKRYRRDFRP
jgi:hypothetical protein